MPTAFASSSQETRVAEAARRASNSVEVLQSRYAKCFYEGQPIIQRIEGLLSSYGRAPEPDERDEE
jgi:hypothetical protein